MITSIILADYSDNTSKAEVTYANGEKTFLSLEEGQKMVGDMNILCAGTTGSKSLSCSWKVFTHTHPRMIN